MADYKTKTPQMMGQFFKEVDSEKYQREKSLYEHCHGAPGEVIEVIFFQEIPGKCATQIKEDGKFAEIKSYNFSSYAVSKDFAQRQLLVTVSL